MNRDVALAPACIARAESGDIEAATRCFVSAFAADPLMKHFFGDEPRGRAASTETFFSLLMRARVALGAPTLVARDGGRVLGGAMGYATQRPEWPADLAREWSKLEGTSPDIAARFEAYERISCIGEPAEPHYYLGVIGVAPELRGTGLGSSLLRAFCHLSAADPASTGVYLETGNPANVPFYARHGFQVRCEEAMGEGRLWCMFLPHHR